MSIHKVEFWSDHIIAPPTAVRRLSDDAIRRRMISALEDHDGDGDLFACATEISQVEWNERRFCFVKQGGEIYEDEVES